jgi:predicted LPLAT superfamily acyltransferase
VSEKPPSTLEKISRKTAWAHSRERGNIWAMRLMAVIALQGGRRVARWVLHPITLYFLLLAPTARRHSLRYLARALGRKATWHDAYRHFYCFAATVLDRVYLLRDQTALFELKSVGQEQVFSTVDEGHGAIMIGAHMGSFEAIHAAGKPHAGLRMAMVMYPDNARLIRQSLAAIAPDVPAPIIALGRAESILTVRDWLDDGGVAGLLGDRSLPGESSRVGTLQLSFLGCETTFSDGAIRLAALLRRRVYLMVGIYMGGNRYEMRFEPLADFTQRAENAAARDAHIKQAVQTYVVWLEELCRAHPYNWFNFFDYWHED